MCSRLKPEVSGVLIDYEHIRFGGPSLWQHLFHVCQAFFLNHAVSADLETGIILPLFKGKGAKANNKDNYRGITMFSTLTQIYEMVLLDRLEKFADENVYFSNLQFGFQEGVGCLEASFTILESINHILFSELGIKGRMWVAIKDLYTDVKAQVLYELKVFFYENSRNLRKFCSLHV